MPRKLITVVCRSCGHPFHKRPQRQGQVIPYCTPECGRVALECAATTGVAVLSCGDDGVVCLLCGLQFRMIGSHLTHVHGMDGRQRLSDRLVALGLPAGTRLASAGFRQRQRNHALEMISEGRLLADQRPAPVGRQRNSRLAQSAPQKAASLARGKVLPALGFAYMMAQSPKERSEAARRRAAALPAEVKTRIGRVAALALVAQTTHEERSEAARARESKKTSEEIRARGRAGAKTRWGEDAFPWSETPQACKKCGTVFFDDKARTFCSRLCMYPNERSATAGERTRITEMRTAGLSYKTIAKAIGIGKTQVERIVVTSRRENR